MEKSGLEILFEEVMAKKKKESQKVFYRFTWLYSEMKVKDKRSWNEEKSSSHE